MYKDKSNINWNNKVIALVKKEDFIKNEKASGLSDAELGKVWEAAQPKEAEKAKSEAAK